MFARNAVLVQRLFASRAHDSVEHIFIGKCLTQCKHVLFQHCKHGLPKPEFITHIMHLCSVSMVYQRCRTELVLHEVFLNVLCTCTQHGSVPVLFPHCPSMLLQFMFLSKCPLTLQATCYCVLTMLHFTFLDEMFTVRLSAHAAFTQHSRANIHLCCKTTFCCMSFALRF